MKTTYKQNRGMFSNNKHHISESNLVVQHTNKSLSLISKVFINFQSLFN